MILNLKFPSEESAADYSAYLIDDSVRINRRLMNDARHSVVDTCSFKLRYDRTLQNDLFTASDWILVELNDDDGYDLFTGVIAPTFSLRKKENVMPISVEAVDNSYRLDEPINTSFNYPSSIGGTAYAIYDNEESSNNLVWELLDDAGYTPASDIATGAPGVSNDDGIITVEYFQGTKDEETYREYLDDLLSEYGYVFYFTKGGKFSLYKWDKNTVSSEFTINEDIFIRKRDVEYDGFEVEFAQTDTKSDALLYRANLPISQTAGEWEFTGEAIADDDYWPPDGDINDIWQNYKIKWLDDPWLARETRLKNKDIALIAADASNSSVSFIADDDVDISESEYEARRARVLFRNTSGGMAKIYNFEINGTALYRKHRRYTRCPDTSTHPKKYVARFLYDGALATVQEHATRFAGAMNNVIQNGGYTYEWTERTERSVGDIGNVEMTDPSISQNVVVVDKIYNPARSVYQYRATGINAYTTYDVLERGDAIEAGEGTEDPTRPTKTEIDDGYTNDDPDASNPGTTTPTTPTLTVQGVFKGYKLFWDKQSNLTNLSHYEVQVSDDNSTWYSLALDGTDWKDAAGADTDTVDEQFHHQNLPFDGTDDDPQTIDLYYRVRRKTLDGTVSSWSTPATDSTYLIQIKDIAADSVSANKILAGAVTANKMNAENFFFTKAVGSENQATPASGDVRSYIGKDPAGDQADSDPVGISIEEYNGENYEPKFKVAMRSGGGVADAFVSGFLEAGESVLSSPGLIWTLRSEAPTDLALGAAYGNNTFVTVCDNGEIFRSTDAGETWSSISNSFTDRINGVAFGNDVFIAVGDDGELAKSTDDGATWGSLITSQFGSTDIRSIYYGNGTWITGGESGKMSRSTDDGATWSSLITNPFGTGTITGIAYDGTGVWVASATVSDGDGGVVGVVARSTDDGVTWSDSSISTPLNQAQALGFGGGAWVLVGATTDGSTEAAIARSIDGGQSWSSATHEFTNQVLYGVGYGDGIWVAGGISGQVARSTDGGATWGARVAGDAGVSVPYGTSGSMAGFAYSEDSRRWMMVGSTSTTGFIATSDWLEAGAGIVEQGSNSNGEYVVFSSGLQVCWGSFTRSTPTRTGINFFGNTAGFVKYGNKSVTFPKAFGASPRVFPAGRDGTHTVKTIATLSESTTGATIQVINDDSNDTISCTYMAIGMAG